MTSPQQSSFRFAVTRDATYLNDEPLHGAGPPSDFYSVFGVPDRILGGSTTPAPVGYRNNQFHYYDRHGITLNEHHYTYQVHAINLVFDTGMADQFDSTGGWRREFCAMRPHEEADTLLVVVLVDL